MAFQEVLAQVLTWLQRGKRVSYRAVKRQFGLDDDYLEDVKEALFFAHPVVDEDGRGLVWTSDPGPSESDVQPGADAERRFYTLLQAVLGLLLRRWDWRVCGSSRANTRRLMTC